MRKRNNNISFRLSDEEKEIFDNLRNRTGLSENSLVMQAISGVTLTPVEYTEALKELNLATAHLTEQVKRIGVNVNQLTRVANSTANIDALNRIEQIKDELKALQGRCDTLWRYTNQSIPERH